MPISANQARPRVIRIVIVEPRAVARATLREMLSWDADLAIASEVASIEAAADVVHEEPADVVLVDAELADTEPVDGLRRMKRESPGTMLILLGHRRDDDELLRAIESGAAAHVLDTVRPTELVDTIRAVAGGEYVIHQSVATRPTLARRVLEAFREASALGQTPDRTTASSPIERLSDWETEILTAISRGMSNEDIATELAITESTVKRLVTGVLRKLAANNRNRLSSPLTAAA